MTDAISPPGHLDDLRLSAVVDGEARPDEVLHTEGCDPCRERLAAMRAAVALVATPVAPPAAARREDAIATALAASAGPPSLVAVGRERRRRPAAPRWLLPAAAAVTALALAGAVLGSLGGEGSTERADTAARGRTEASSAPDEDATGAERLPPEAEAGSAPVALGPESDLAALVIDGLGQEAAAPATDEQATDDQATHDAAAALTLTRRALAECEQVVRAREEGLGPLRYSTDATWEGRPALVLALDAGSASEPLIRVFVLGRDDCTLYRSETFARPR